MVSSVLLQSRARRLPGFGALCRTVIPGSYCDGGIRRSGISRMRTVHILHTTYHPPESHRHPVLPNIDLNKQLKSSPKSVILLTTPKYASSILSEDFQSHLQSALAQQNPGATTDAEEGRPIEVLAAVVDGLPHRPDQKTIDLVVKSRLDGWSWLVSDQELLSAHNPDAKPSESGEPIPGGPSWVTNEPGKISFTFLESGGAGSTRSHGRTVTLPLANTIFQTGLLSTIARFSVSKDGSPSPSPASSLKTSPNVVHIPPTNEAVKYIYTSDLPLVTLTRFRKVLACAGNIVRRIQVPYKDGPQSVPASQELEQVVSAFDDPDDLREQFIDRSKKLNVFAYILYRRDVPRNDLPRASKNWTMEKVPRLAVKTLNAWSLIKHGKGSLRRVLSGGGGWGNKQGLLSLDYGYDPAYSGVQDDEAADEQFRRNFEETFFGKGEEAKYAELGVDPSEGEGAATTQVEHTPRGGGGGIIEVDNRIQFLAAANKAPHSLLQETPNPPPFPIKNHFRFACIGKEGDDSSLKARPTFQSQDGGQPTPTPTTTATTTEEETIEFPGLFGGASDAGFWISGHDGSVVNENQRDGLSDSGSLSGKGSEDVGVKSPQGGDVLERKMPSGRSKTVKIDVPAGWVGVEMDIGERGN